MIYDTLKNLGRYAGMSANLDKVIAFLQSHDLSALPMGRTDVDGDHVYVNVMEAAATPGQGRSFETHDRYMDLQIDLEGVERCEVALGEVREAVPYDPERDIAMWDGDADAVVTLGPGRFALFLVGEPHKPGILAGEDAHLKKAVFKIEG